jgi:hypothetical protein
MQTIDCKRHTDDLELEVNNLCKDGSREGLYDVFGHESLAIFKNRDP